MRKLLFLSLPFLFFTCGESHQELAPNIVVLFADDLGYGDLGCFGNSKIKTPVLDQMAKEGAKATNFYAASPACTASRYAILTGQYPVRSGFPWVLFPYSARGIHPSELTIAEALQKLDYATACIGKWHLGTADQKYSPNANGFDYYFGLPYSNDMIPPLYPAIPLLENQDTVALGPDQGRLTAQYIDQAISFFDSDEQSKFVYIPFAMPHVPLHTTPKFAGVSERGLYGDVVEEMDYNIGRLMQGLDSLGQLDNTIIIFTSDNGPWIIKGALGGSSGVLKDGKGSTWEGGMRVPAIFWNPKRIKAGKIIETPMSTLDLFSTIMDLAGSGSSHQTDGRSLCDILMNEKPRKDETFFYYGPGNKLQAARKGKWKLHIRTNSQTGKTYFEDPMPLLFDLEEDIGESKNVATAFPKIVSEMLEEIETHKAQIDEDSNFFEKENPRVNHLGTEAKVMALEGLSEKYGAVSNILDGRLTDPDALYEACGFEGNDMLLELDLGDVKEIDHIKISTIVAERNWIFQAEEIQISCSMSGNTYQSFDATWETSPNSFRKIASAKIEGEARYIKIKVLNRGTCPQGHQGEGKPAWIFVDEIIIE